MPWIPTPGRRQAHPPRPERVAGARRDRLGALRPRRVRRVPPRVPPLDDDREAAGRRRVGGLAGGDAERRHGFMPFVEVQRLRVAPDHDHRPEVVRSSPSGGTGRRAGAGSRRSAGSRAAPCGDPGRAPSSTVEPLAGAGPASRTASRLRTSSVESTGFVFVPLGRAREVRAHGGARRSRRAGPSCPASRWCAARRRAWRTRPRRAPRGVHLDRVVRRAGRAARGTRHERPHRRLRREAADMDAADRHARRASAGGLRLWLRRRRGGGVVRGRGRCDCDRRRRSGGRCIGRRRRRRNCADPGSTRAAALRAAERESDGAESIGPPHGHRVYSRCRKMRGRS